MRGGIVRLLGVWFCLLFSGLVSAQPLVVVRAAPVANLRQPKEPAPAATGLVHLGTGKLPEPSTEPEEQLIARAQKGEIRLAVLSDYPSLPAKLRFVLLYGATIPPGTTLRSASTRTTGLITAADLTGEGRPLEFVAAPRRTTLELARQIIATERAKVPVLALWGSFAGLAMALALAALHLRNLDKLARSGFVFAAAGLLALLPAGWAPAADLHLLFFVAATLVIGAVLASRQVEAKRSGVVPLLQLLVVVVALDTIFGWGMVANATLSGYYGSGIRFYGIGNEYMGLLIGAALMSVPVRWLPVVGAALVALLGLSFWGANAGGALAAIVAFFPPVPGKRWRLVLPVAVALALAGVERLLPSAAQSHIGQAAEKSATVWTEIIVRKLAMNARLTTALPTLLGLAGVGAAALVMAKARFTQPIREQVAQQPELRQRVVAAAWGGAAALVFNDSGIVALLLLLAPVLVVLVENALRR